MVDRLDVRGEADNAILGSSADDTAVAVGEAVAHSKGFVEQLCSSLVGELIKFLELYANTVILTTDLYKEPEKTECILAEDPGMPLEDATEVQPPWLKSLFLDAAMTQVSSWLHHGEKIGCLHLSTAYFENLGADKLTALRQKVGTDIWQFFAADLRLYEHHCKIGNTGMTIHMGIALLFPKLMVVSKIVAWMEAHPPTVESLPMDQPDKFKHWWSRVDLMELVALDAPLPVQLFQDDAELPIEYANILDNMGDVADKWRKDMGLVVTCNLVASESRCHKSVRALRLEELVVLSVECKRS